ncbi:MAG: PP0621 family protein [Burkholderiales bacterium]|nr:hypothetical protein [Sulfuricellaceae bacterium]
MKLLFFLFLVLLVYVLVFKKPQARPRPNFPGPGKGEDMVRCAQCGVHLPRSEGVLSQGEFYCSDEHRRQHQASSAASD